MSLIANKFNPKKLIALGPLSVGLMGGVSAFALGTSSTATLFFSDHATGPNINVHDGSAYVSAFNENDYIGQMAATVKKSVFFLPDSVAWNKIMAPGTLIMNQRISLPDVTTYYPEATSDIKQANGWVTLDDNN